MHGSRTFVSSLNSNLKSCLLLDSTIVLVQSKYTPMAEKVEKAGEDVKAAAASVADAVKHPKETAKGETKSKVNACKRDSHYSLGLDFLHIFAPLQCC